MLLIDFVKDMSAIASLKQSTGSENKDVLEQLENRSQLMTMESWDNLIQECGEFKM
jgi:hypothetical protein